MQAISTKQLRYFHALSRLRHFGKAADQCAVTQPALSMQIKDLEETLGLSLVIRGKSSITLTPDGEEVARRAEKILAGIQDISDYAKTRSGLLSGAFRLGIIPTIAPYILPKLLPKIRATYPEIELKLRETNTAQLQNEGLFQVGARQEFNGTNGSRQMIETDFLWRAPAFSNKTYITNVEDRAGQLGDNELPSLRARYARIARLSETASAEYGIIGRMMQPGKSHGKRVTQRQSSLYGYGRLDKHFEHGPLKGADGRIFIEAAHIRDIQDGEDHAGKTIYYNGQWYSAYAQLEKPVLHFGKRKQHSLSVVSSATVQSVPYKDGNKPYGGAEVGVKYVGHINDRLEIQALAAQNLFYTQDNHGHGSIKPGMNAQVLSIIRF